MQPGGAARAAGCVAGSAGVFPPSLRAARSRQSHKLPQSNRVENCAFDGGQRETLIKNLYFSTFLKCFGRLVFTNVGSLDSECRAHSVWKCGRSITSGATILDSDEKSQLKYWLFLIPLKISVFLVTLTTMCNKCCFTLQSHGLYSLIHQI
jgi:hypothetical protein